MRHFFYLVTLWTYKKTYEHNLYRSNLVQGRYMTNFISNVIYSFFVSFGVVLGACIFAGIGAVINNDPPLKTMYDLAASVKIWAVATALGGTFSSFELLEGGLFRGEVKLAIKQVLYILAALIGANLGFNIIKLLDKCGDIWTK